MRGVVNNTYEAYVQEALKHNRTSKVPQWLERLIAVTRIKLGRVDRSLVPELRVVSVNLTPLSDETNQRVNEGGGRVYVLDFSCWTSHLHSCTTPAPTKSHTRL